jgi:hypothetical protein
MADEGQLVTSIRRAELDLPPSCIEFCPAFPSYFVVGTYSLQPDGSGNDNGQGGEEENGERQERARQPQSRKGSIILFRLIEGEL